MMRVDAWASRTRTPDTGKLFLGQLLTLSLRAEQLDECYAIGDHCHANHAFGMIEAMVS
jgi:hypothetical protein